MDVYCHFGRYIPFVANVVFLFMRGVGEILMKITVCI